MNRKTLSRTLWLLTAALALLCGTTFALMFRQTSLLENRFDTAVVDCVIHEQLDDSGDYTNGIQTAEKKTSITVKNTGNIDAFIRVRFVSYWMDSEGNIVSKASQMPAVNVTDNWIEGSDGIFYCKQAVAPDGFTPELLGSAIELAEVGDDGYFQVVEVFADAIQSLPETAAELGWNVNVTDEQIISAP